MNRDASGSDNRGTSSMSQDYFTSAAVAGQGIKAVHQRPFCANEDSHIVGRFDAATAWATFPKLELSPPHCHVAIILDIDSTEGLDDAPGEGKSTVLINELEEGRLYEPVITSFYGMPFTRMRQGDLLRVIGHNEHGLPLFEFHERADDIIDLGSIARIDTATLTEALEIVGFRERDWSASKEYEGDRPILHVHVNADPERVPELRRKIHRALGVVDPHYREACYTMGARLLRVTAAKSDVVTAPAPTFEVDENAVTADETPVAAHRSGGA